MILQGPRSDIAAQLIDLEAALRQLDLWSDQPPSAEAMQSEQPFAMDTMDFEQWLQFIFLGRMREILEQGDALPESCAIFPYVEMLSGAGKSVHPKLAELVQQVDWSIAGESGSGERI